MPDLVVTNLHKEFNGTSVLHDVSFTVADGEFFTLLGPSGCGKSTTLSCLAGLERPTSGSIVVGDVVFADGASGAYVPAEERNLGMVFQSYALWPHMTVAQNCAMPLSIRRVPKAEQQRAIGEALDKVGLGRLSGRYPHELSGGQQQRVALARALVYSPRVLLLDEPLSNLDAKLREQARLWLKRLQQDLGITTIYVTHDQEEALAMSDRIAVMSEGDMVQVGPPEEIYRRPATASVAAFIGRTNFLTGTVAAVDALSGACDVVLDATGETVTAPTRTVQLRPGARATVAFRPEAASLDGHRAGAPTASTLTAEVLTASFLGSRYEYDLRCGDSILRVDADEPGLRGTVRVAIRPEALNAYPLTAAAQDAEVAELVSTIT